MGIRRTKHAVYDLKYQLIWIPKYRKHVLTTEVAGYLKELFNHIAEEYGFAIDTMGVVEDHVHILLEAPPRYAPAEVVQITKNISGQKSCGTISYFVRSVGDKVTSDIIRKCVKY